MSRPTRSPADYAQLARARALLALPGPAKRRIAGGTPAPIDGAVLDPEAQLMLFVLDKDRAPTLESQSPAEARGHISHDAALFSGRPLPMATVKEFTVAGADGPLRARRYVPEGYREPGPALVYLHGGGWVVGDIDTHDTPCRVLARHSGVQVVSVDYRLAPEHPFPAPVHDALAAFRDVHGRADELGADPARIAVGGDSAGGHLAATTALHAARDSGPAPAFQLLIYPVTDCSKETESYDKFGAGYYLTRAQMDWYRDHFLPPGADRSDPLASPLLAPDLAGVAPAHVITAGFDPLRDEGEAYAERLRDAGVAVSLRRAAGLIHGFVNMAGVGRASRDATIEAAGALGAGLAMRA